MSGDCSADLDGKDFGPSNKDGKDFGPSLKGGKDFGPSQKDGKDFGPSIRWVWLLDAPWLGPGSGRSVHEWERQIYAKNALST